MKRLVLSLTVFSTLFIGVTAQSVDEIVNNHLEAMGGEKAWSDLKGYKMNAKVNVQGGMTLPIEFVTLKDGRSYSSFEFQGNTVVQQAFDGETSWGVNFMTMKPEKSDAEQTENTKRDSKDFPSVFIGYKEKGYKLELLGKETVEGVECFKLKLTKGTKLVDGKEEDNISFHYLDTETFAQIMSESTITSGQMKGQIAQEVFSDYQEVDGLYFPFSILSRIKDGDGQAINIESYELNPTVDDSVFKFPEEPKEEEK